MERLRRVSALLLAVAAAGGVAAVAPAAALGAEAFVTAAAMVQYGSKGPDIPYTEYTVTFASAPGEANAPRLSIGPGRVITIADAGAPVAAGAMCRAAGERETRCEPGAGPVRLRVLLGDGDDAIAPKALPAESFIGVEIDSGPGADRLDLPARSRNLVAAGGDGDDRLRGADGGEKLLGGPGADVLDGGEGQDSVTGGPGHDELIGGPGADEVSWTEAATPVVADLAAGGLAGPADDPDRISGMESAVGGAADDTLLGTEGGDRLVGGGGADRLDGRGGGDELRGEQGADRLTGGPGNDFMDGDDSPRDDDSADDLDGGPGRDTLRGFVGRDVLQGGPGDDTIEAPVAAARVDAGAGDDDVQLGADGDRPTAAERAAVVLACGPGDDHVYGREAPARFPRDCETALVGDLLFPYEVETDLRLLRGRLLVPVPEVCERGDEPCRVGIALLDGRRRLARRSVAPRRAGRQAAFRADARIRRALRSDRLVVRYEGYADLRLSVRRR